mmetsp:Transcript_22296/g.61633  ORF Transcript_22296/g.61633 Transcript_22296/m.61633 type:complete len:239 (+) Transcript_22296:2901-3617(+)
METYTFLAHSRASTRAMRSMRPRSSKVRPVFCEPAVAEGPATGVAMSLLEPRRASLLEAPAPSGNPECRSLSFADSMVSCMLLARTIMWLASDFPASISFFCCLKMKLRRLLRVSAAWVGSSAPELLLRTGMLAEPARDGCCTCSTFTLSAISSKWIWVAACWPICCMSAPLACATACTTCGPIGWSHANGMGACALGATSSQPCQDTCSLFWGSNPFIWPPKPPPNVLDPGCSSTPS